MPPFPPLSPAERLLSWVGLISWSKPDILENVCSGTEQAGIFISRLHLHCFLSWRGAGGRREDEMWLLRASPRGAQAHPSSPPSPASAAVAAWDLWRQAPLELWKDQPSWKSQLATIRPFPLPARCAFVWVACLQESPFVGSFMLFFYEAKIGDKQVLRCFSQQVKILSLVLSRC